MNRIRHSRNKRHAWAAICLLLLQALFPALVHAVSAAGTSDAQICTAYGIKKISAAANSSVDTSVSAKHCPVCALANVDALPTSENAAVFANSFSEVSASHAPAWVLIEPRLRPYLRGPPCA